MRLLLDGDVAQNNGNWQWIASVGVDPAPLFRRMYNPMLQQHRHDPDGEYVRRWVPDSRDAGADRRPRGRAPAHAGGLQPRPRLVSSRASAPSRSSPADRSRSPPPRASSPAGRPGRASSTTRRSRLRFLVDDWSGPATVTFTQDGDDRPRGRSRPTTRSARSSRPRAIVSLDHDGTGYAAIDGPDRAGAAAAERLPAPGAVPLALRGRRLVGPLRPHRPRAGRRSCATRSPPTASSRARSSCSELRRARRAARRTRSRACTASPRPRSRAGSTASRCSPHGRQRGLHRAAGAARHRPVLRRADPAPRRRPDRRRRPRASHGSSKAVQARYGRPLADVADGWRPFRTWVSVLMRANA